MITVAQKLRLLLLWARAKRFVIPIVVGLVAFIVGRKLTKKSAPGNFADRAATDKILADAIRPHLQARVEAHQAKATAALEAAKDEHRKVLTDVARVHVASPRELEAMLQEYARKSRNIVKLLPLAIALWAGSVHAQGMPESLPNPETNEPGYWLPVDVARSLLEAGARAAGLDRERVQLERAVKELEQTSDAHADAAQLNFEALQSAAEALAESQRREAVAKAKLHVWYRRPAVLLVTGLVLGAVGVTAIAVTL